MMPALKTEKPVEKLTVLQHPVKLTCIPSLSAEATFDDLPWEFKLNVPESVVETKEEFKKWGQQPATKHLFFNGFTGVNPSMRVTKKTNPVFECRAIVADYDITTMTNKRLQEALDSCPTEFVPQHASLTYSNGARLVWVLEKPVLISGSAAASKFMDYAAKALKMEKILPGLDKPALKDPSKNYEVGHSWINTFVDPIKPSFIWDWIATSGKKLQYFEDTEIPLDAVFERLSMDFPNKWGDKPFEAGQRSCRFWDPDASDETAAVLKPDGFLCFTGDVPFMSWRRLLGDSFVDHYTADKFGGVLRDFVYDGQKYWSESQSKFWVPCNAESFRISLKVGSNLDSRVTKGSTPSEVDKAINDVQLLKRVDSAMPFVHMHPGPITIEGKQYLNTSDVFCMPPASKQTTREWGDGFPWMAKFLDELFEPHDQLLVLLAWWKRFYEGGHKLRPELGHALFIVGPSNCGKTLFSSNILSKSVGGHMDATEFLLGGSGFTASCVKAPIMSIDDGVSSGHSRDHATFAKKLKALIANPTQRYNEKYAQEGLVKWHGRVLVTLNDDPDALQMLPDLQKSLMDKLIILKAKRPAEDFPPSWELEKIILKELPHLLSWLLNWEVPKEISGNNRFGVASYCNDDIKHEATSISNDQSFVDLMHMYFAELKVEEPNTTQWVGSPTKLLNDMHACEAISNMLLKDYSAIKVGKALGRLMAVSSYSIERRRVKSGTHWTVDIGLELKEETDHE